MEELSPNTSNAEQVAERKLQVTVAKAIMIAGIGTWIAGWFAAGDELITPWDAVLLPLTSTFYIVAGLMAYFKPKWNVAGLALALIPTSVYEQGVFYFVVHYPDKASYYTAAGSGPWFPLYYVALFIAFPKGAAKWSWLHYSGFVLQFLFNNFLPGDPSTAAQRLPGEHLLVEVLMAHPAYIVALSIIIQLQDRLHATKEEAFRSKQNFLAMLSHEIRNLLQTMMGAIDLLDLKIKEPVPRQSVARLSKATTQLQTYLNDIIEFTRLDDPSMRVNAAPFDAVRMLQELREQWLPEAADRGIDLHLDIDEASRDGLRTAVSDEARWRQIVSNLVSNSLKYTPQGSVTVSATLDSATRRVRLNVVDTGIGIDADSLEKIFQPYVRLENAKRQSAEGSGLGLAVVERLVKRLKGHIVVTSELGKGTVLHLELPLQNDDRGSGVTPGQDSTRRQVSR